MMLFGSWVADQGSGGSEPAHQGGDGPSPGPGQGLGRSSKAPTRGLSGSCENAGSGVCFLPEIAKRLGVSKKTVVRLIREHQRIQDTDGSNDV